MPTATETIKGLEAALSDPDREHIKVTMRRETAELFLDFLRDWDTDMPARPVAKVLGPLVGDVVMNRKLERLEALTDQLGPAVLLLQSLLDGRAAR